MPRNDSRAGEAEKDSPAGRVASGAAEQGGDAPPTEQALPFGTVLVLLVVVGGVMPIVFAWHFGALGIPRNDDWAYAYAVFHFADTAKVNGYSWAGMNLVGQLVLSVPVVWLFGHRIAALQIEVAALGVLGLLATFDLAKQLLSPRRALFVAVLVGVLPMWASLSASYMTDVPAFALAMVCLALGARAVARPTVRVGYFSASLAVGFLAFTIRENGIVAPLAVSAVTVWVAARRPRVRLSPIIAAIAGLVASAALFFLWRRSLPGFINAKPRVPSLSLVGRAADVSWQSALLVGLLVTPAIVLADPRRLFRIARARAPRVTLVAGGATAVVGAAILRQGRPAHVLGPGDYVLPNGTLGTEMLKGTRPDLIPRYLLAVLAVVGVLALVVLVCALAATVTKSVASVRQRRFEMTASPAFLIVALAAFGYAVGCVLPVALGYSKNLFDRYLLPIVPLVAILVLRSGGPTVAASRRARIAGCSTLAVLAVFGAVYAANSASFDGTKWRVASQAVRLARDPKRVDGGHIWNDNSARRHLRGPFKGACIVLRAGPRPATGEAGVVGVGSVWGPTATQGWVVARQVRPC